MFKYSLLFFFLVGSFHSHSANLGSFKALKADDVFITLPGTSIILSLADYVKLKPADIKKLSGQRLTLKETISFKITQRQIKKTIRKDGTVDLLAFYKKSGKPFKWHWGGFFLGLLLPIVGLVIAALIKDDKKRDRANSAAIGTLVVCAGFVLLLLSNF
jgi:hypothetical protein